MAALQSRGGSRGKPPGGGTRKAAIVRNADRLARPRTGAFSRRMKPAVTSAQAWISPQRSATSVISLWLLALSFCLMW